MSYYSLKQRMTHRYRDYQKLSEWVAKTYNLLTSDPCKKELDSVGVTLSEMDTLGFAVNHLGREFGIVFALTNASEGRLFAVASLYEKPRWTELPIQRSKAYLDRAGNIFWKPDDTFSDFALPHESVLDFIFKILLDVPAASIDSANSRP